MILLIQRVREASVHVDERLVGAIAKGLLLFCCVEPGDTPAVFQKAAHKVARLRIFEDDGGRMNWSLLDVGGAALVVSQFTLCADTRQGHRPSFSNAASPEKGREGYEAFVAALLEQGVLVQTGEFGAHMRVSLVNDGPATFSMRL